VNTLRPRIKPIAWLALVAMLAMALLPMVSHALAFSRGDAGRWAEVCTPQGMRLVLVDADSAVSDAPPVQAASHLEHCPSCALGADSLGLPPTHAPAPPQPLFPGHVPLLFLHAPHTLFAWLSAQPRGPPLAS
jgi:hypothetical protein